MPAINLQTLKDTSAQFGVTRDWTTPQNPITGSVWYPQERVKGEKYSIGHRRSPDGKYRKGGPFFSIKFRTIVDSGRNTTYRSGWGIAYQGRYNGSLGANQYVYSYMNMWGYDTDSINSKAFAYGAQALAILRPDRPDFSPLTSLAELMRELPFIRADWKNFNERYNAELRRLKRVKGTVINRAGRSNLAIQFGIMPLISDIKAWMEAYQGAHKRAHQLLRDNGRWVRREGFLSAKPDDKYNLFRTDNFTTGSHPNMSPTHVTQCYSSKTGEKAYTRNSNHLHVHIWCSGMSKYFLPDDIIGHPKGGKVLLRRIHTMLKIDPATIYNLIPWSWFVDYFTNLGSYFDALSGGIADRIVFKYAYIMRTEVHYDRAEMTQFVYKSLNTTGPVTVTVNREGVLKSRVHASLLGFGLKESDLNLTQWGILGSLGASKL